LLGQSVSTLMPSPAQGESESGALVRRDSTLEFDDHYYAQAPSASEQFESTLYDRNGREFLAEIARRRIDTEDGTLVMSLIRDITERRRIAVALDESEERYRTVAETASDVIIGVGEDGRIQFANSSVQRVLGYKPSEIEGMKMTKLMPEYLRD